jgi:methylmalonyl-CoA mutase
VRLGATVGEVSSAMEAVFGRYAAATPTVSGVYAAAAKSMQQVEAIQQRTRQFEAEHGRRPRILVAKVGQDGHDRGARVIASAFADLGFDVDVGPLFQTPDEVAQQAIENDVHICGISTLAGAHRTLVPELVQALKRHGKAGILVVAGGVIPQQDWPALRQAGVAEVFGPGTVIPEAAGRLLDLLAKQPRRAGG